MDEGNHHITPPKRSERRPSRSGGAISLSGLLLVAVLIAGVAAGYMIRNYMCSSDRAELERVRAAEAVEKQSLKDAVVRLQKESSDIHAQAEKQQQDLQKSSQKDQQDLKDSLAGSSARIAQLNTQVAQKSQQLQDKERQVAALRGKPAGTQGASSGQVKDQAAREQALAKERDDLRAQLDQLLAAREGEECLTKPVPAEQRDILNRQVRK